MSNHDTRAGWCRAVPGVAVTVRRVGAAVVQVAGSALAGAPGGGRPSGRSRPVRAGAAGAEEAYPPTPRARPGARGRARPARARARPPAAPPSCAVSAAFAVCSRVCPASVKDTVLATTVRRRLVALDPARADEGREQLRDRWAGHACAPGELGGRERLVDARPVRDCAQRQVLGDGQRRSRLREQPLGPARHQGGGLDQRGRGRLWVVMFASWGWWGHLLLVKSA